MSKLFSGQVARPTPPENRRGFIQVREPGTNWLLFLYDPERQIVEVQRRGVKTVIDLSRLTLDTDNKP